MAKAARAAPPNFSVAEALAARTDDQLQALLVARPDLASPPPANVRVLADRVSGWSSVRTCLEGCDGGVVQVVHALCLLPSPTTTGALADLLGIGAGHGNLAGRESLDRALARLEARALVFRPGDDQLHLLPAVRQHISQPAQLGPAFADAARSVPPGKLHALAALLDLRVPPAARATALARAVAEGLRDPGRLQRALRGAPRGTDDLVQRLAQGPPVVFAQHGLHRVDDRSPLGWLLQVGLLLPADWDGAVLPAEAAVALRGGRLFANLQLDPPQIPTTPVDPEAVDTAAAERALALVTDLAELLDSWGRKPPKLLKDGSLGLREVKRAAKALGRDEVETARVIDLASAAGLAASDWPSGTARPTPEFDDWLALDAANRWAGLAQGWLGCRTYLSVAGARDPKDKPIPPLLGRPAEPGAEALRAAVLAAYLSAGALGTAQAADPEALRARVRWQSPNRWTSGPAHPETLIGWTIAEADLLGLTALGALSSPGRELAEGRPQEAAAELRRRAPRVVAEFVLQADLTAVAAGQLEAGVRRELELLAEVESTGAATVYRFGEASVRRAFEAGRTAAEIAAFLESHARRGVPQTLSYLVADVGRRFGQVRVGTATCYVRGPDEALTAEVLRSRRTAKLRLRPLAPTVLATDADPATVVATLQAAGYLPAREGADGALQLARPAAHRTSGRPGQGAASRFEEPLVDLARTLAQRGAELPPALAALLLRDGGEGGDGDDGGDGVDPERRAAEVVAALRAAPARPPAQGPPPPTVPGTGRPPLALVDDEPYRPSGIVRGRSAVTALLREAVDEEWAVRLSYAGTIGGKRGGQLNVGPLQVKDGLAFVEVLPEFVPRTLHIGAIEWARVLTQAEEEAIFT
jgi:hypothetical protein